MRVCDTWEVRCPKCGNEDKIEVLIEAWARFMPDGTDTTEPDDGSHEWDEDSRCDCRACGHTGRAWQFAKLTEEPALPDLPEGISMTEATAYNAVDYARDYPNGEK